MNIVIIPCWNRPEFLANTIEHIIISENAANQFYVFVQDSPDNEDVTGFINGFPFFNHHLKIKQKTYEGNTFVMSIGLLYASQLANNFMQSELIYVIEEDVRIGKDFFNFHEQVHRQFEPFAISSVYNHNRKKQEFENKPDVLYADKNFQGVGVSINQKFLGEICKHLTQEYCSNPYEYCQQHFPQSKISWPDWDGLCGKIMQSMEQKCIYPFTSRAVHTGFTGLHRSGVVQGLQLHERINNLREMTEQEMNEASNIKDIRFCDLDTVYNIDQFKLETVKDYKWFI